MISVTKNGENRIDIHINGKIDSEDMSVALEQFMADTEDFNHGLMYYTIEDFQWPSLSAIGVKFGQLPKLFGLIKKIDRAAIVADETWLRKIAELEGALIPGIDIRGFEPGEEAAAEAWLTKG